jgi:Nucleoside-diphosphate-sugar epimerases
MILIFGGTGFVGQHVAQRLATAGHQVTVTGHRGTEPALLRDRIAAGQVAVRQLDLLDAFAVLELTQQLKPEIVMDLSGHAPGVLSPARDVQFRTGVLLNILEAARINSVRRVVLMSSADAYWGLPASDSPYREDDNVPLLEPDNHYIVQAWAKKTMELVGNLYRRCHGLDIAFVRASGIYGPLYRTWMNVPSRLLRAAVTGDYGHPLPHAESGYDQVYVEDAAEGLALVALAPSLAHPVYNIGAGRVPLYAEFAEALRDLVPGFDLTLPTRGDAPPDTMDSRWMDIDRARTELGYAPRFTPRSAMQAWLEWVSRHGL